MSATETSQPQSPSIEPPTELKLLPLKAVHEQLGAQFTEHQGWRVPRVYTNIADEYEVVRGQQRQRQMAGVIDLSARARIEVKGADAVQFLNGMLTNDLAALETNSWMLAAFPNVQGRLIAFARVLRTAANTFLLDLEPATHHAILKSLMRFTFAGDFQVTDKTADILLLSVQGTRAAEIIAQAFNEQAANVANNSLITTTFEDATVHLIRATHTGENGFDLFVEVASAAKLFNLLIKLNAQPVGFDALETLRIEAGIPRHNQDIDETNIVLEAGRDEAVSYTKGCYLGQEIIARIHWRGHVARQIAQIVFDDNLPVERGAKLYAVADEKEAGRITSAAFSPRLNRTVAIALIKYAYLAPDTKLKLTNESGVQRTARVTNNALPAND